MATMWYKQSNPKYLIFAWYFDSISVRLWMQAIPNSILIQLTSCKYKKEIFVHIKLYILCFNTYHNCQNSSLKLDLGEV